MKIIAKYIGGLALSCLMAYATVSCTQEANDTLGVEYNNNEAPVYKMKLYATCNNYTDEPSSRAAFSWTDGAQVYLRFKDSKGDIKGVATYEIATDTWNVKPDKALTAEEMADCEAYHFVNPSSVNALTIGLTPASVIYVDTEATYLLEEDILSVTAVLSPKTGRVRFKGSAGQSFGVTGLSHYSTYNISTNAFTSKTTKLTDKLNDEGYSSFYYVYFTDESERALTFDYVSTASYKRTFSESVLAPASSGFMTVPTAEKHDQWTLVNATNGKEITLPTLSDLAYSSIKSSSVFLEASVTDNGNGTLSDVGFVCATHTEPTLADTKLSCGKKTTFSNRLFSLEPTTQYYVRAYATNEAGTIYSNVASFTTKEAPQGSKIEINDFPEEGNWD
jgi:hypothetical protein